MIVTVTNKYMASDTPYLKRRTLCNVHKKYARSSSIITKLLPSYLKNVCDSLCFNMIEPRLISRFKKLFLMIMLNKYLSNEPHSVTQQDVQMLYSNIKDETSSRCQIHDDDDDTEFNYYFVSIMCTVLSNNIVDENNKLKLHFDSCKCVNVLKFDGSMLNDCFDLYERYDLAYKIISNIKFQDHHDACATIVDEIDKLKLKLMNTSYKIVIMMLGRFDIDSLTSLLCYDIITVIIHHLIHNVHDKWIHDMIK